MPTSFPAAALAWCHRHFGALSVAALLGYGIFLALRFSPEAGGADASGYLHSGRLLTEGKLSTVLRTVPELHGASPYDFQPLGFSAEETSPRLVPTYPVGLPLHLALVCAVAGWHWGPYLVIIGAAWAALALSYALARRLGASRLSATIAAVSLAWCRVFISGAVQPLSDTLATVWCLLAVLAALRARSGGIRWSVACGLAFAAAVYVRPSNVMLLPTLIVLLGCGKDLIAAGFAGLPWAVLLGAYQKYLYGAATRSGYGPIFGIFEARYFWPTLVHFAQWILRLLPFAWLALPALFVLPWSRLRRELIALIAWAAAFILFYAFYQVSHEDWSGLRFIEPAFPPLLVLAALGLDAWRMRSPSRLSASFGAGLAVVATLVAFGANVALGFPNGRRHDRMYVEATHWAREHIPSDAIVVSMLYTGTLYFETPLPALRWDSVSAENGPRYVTALHRAGRPVYAIVHNFEIADPRMKHVPGRWEKLADFGAMSAWRIRPLATAP